ncbi:MAG: hypothetical protein JW722_06040, partial [Demequinaceae bacterium]|nr:hypothetical protein [Demequinaceae bacterium]
MHSRRLTVAASFACLLLMGPASTALPASAAKPTNDDALSVAAVSTVTPSPSPTSAEHSCALYPIALPADLMTAAEPGEEFAEVPLGTGPGNFSWLSWTGSASAPTLAASLVPPGNKEAYVDPDDASVGRPDVGDWVPGAPGVTSSKQVRDNLDALLGEAITVPTWSATRDRGGNLDYRIAGFVEVRITDYRLSGHGWMDLEFVGFTECYNQPPVAVGQEGVTDTDTPLVIVLTGEDPDGDDLTFDVTRPPEHGTLDGEPPSVTYTADEGFVGIDSFDFVARDGSAVSEPATITIQVLVPRHPPVITSAPVTLGKVGDPYQYLVEGADPDGDPLTYSLVSEEPGLTIDPVSGAITGVPVSAPLAESIDASNVFCKSFSRSVSEFDLQLRWQWTNTHPDMISDVFGPPAVARIVDINGDGVVDERDPPTMVFAAFKSMIAEGAYLVALNGATGEELWLSQETTVSGYGSLAVADIDGDGRLDIVGVRPGDRTELAAFDDQGHIKWIVPTGPVNTDFTSDNARDWISIADLDGDGSPEIVHGNRVFNGEGELLWVGEYETGGYEDYGVASIVADLDQDGYQEVIASRVIYTHDGEVQARNTDLPESGFNSIADFTGDGIPEIVYVAEGKLYLLDKDLNVIWRERSIPGGGDGGPATLADLTGDGYPEIAIAASSKYLVYSRTGRLLWGRTIQDYSSHKTGSSVYDFEGDGRASVLYTDEVNFYVFDGPTGATQSVIKTGSKTTYEYPLVVDVTGDGLANIVVPSSQQTSFGGGVSVYESGDLGWMPTRSIWNQHAYSIGNINDDGSVPAHPVASWLTHNTFRLNSFLDREAFGLPDLAVRGLVLHGDGPEYSLSVEVENRGLADYPAPTSLTFSRVDDGGAEVPIGEVEVPALARGETLSVELTGVSAEEVEGAVIKATIAPLPGASQCGTDNDWSAAQAVMVSVADPGGLTDDQLYLLRLTAETTEAPEIVSEPVGEVEARTLFRYTVIAQDPDSGDGLRFALTQAPTGMWMNSVTGEVFWRTGDESVGTHTVVITVEDLAGLKDVQTFTVTVSPSEVTTDPPIVVSQPETDAVIGGEYRYQVVVSSPQGLAIEYALVIAPMGMTIDEASGEILWTPNSYQAGEHFVVVRTTDESLQFDIQEFIVRVTGFNHPPAITSQPPTEVEAGSLFSYAMEAADPDGDAVEFALWSGPIDMTVDAHTGLVAWDTTGIAEGAYLVEVIARDAYGGLASQSFVIQVSGGNEPPPVPVDITPPAVSLHNVTVGVGDTAVIPVSASDASGVASLTVTVDGVEYPIDPGGFVSVPTVETGVFPIVATAIDVHGNGTTVSAWLQVIGADDGVDPTAGFGSPAEGAELRVATPIVGTASDENLLRWSVTATPVLPISSEPIVLGEGTESVVDGVLGIIDPTVLAGGEWYIRLEAVDEGGRVSTVGYVVSSVNEAKYGLFSLTFTDAVVPVAGMPITVQRTYNSGTRSHNGDFGFGWTLSLRTLRLETDNAPGDGWVRENHGTILPNWVLIPTRSHTVTVVDGASESIVFDFTPTFNDPIMDGRYATAAWTERTQTGATLAPVGTVELVQADDGLLSLDTVETYEPEAYVLTMPDGRVFTFSLAEGLTEATDANGNTVTITSNGITSSSGASVVFERDVEGRITSVTTPGGLVTSYTYDDAGNLIAVTDPEGNVTSFVYGTGHYLTGIVDALGRVPARNEYDAAGRLIAVVDAAGNRVEISSDPDLKTETVTDRLGFVTVRRFDERGRLVEVVFPDGSR